METIKAIKPGPKPKKEDGTDDRRQRVNPPTKPKHPTNSIFFFSTFNSPQLQKWLPIKSECKK